MNPEPMSDSFEESDEKLRPCQETADGSHAAKTIERLGWFQVSNVSTVATVPLTIPRDDGEWGRNH